VQVLALFGHGIGGRSDLPLPAWLFAYGAAFALVISFTALRILWPRPRLAAAAPGADLPRPVQSCAPATTWVLRLIGLLVFGVVLYASWRGYDSPAANIAPVALYVVFWVGLQVVSAVAGDVWRALNPFETIAALVGLPERRADPVLPDPGRWTAALGILSFAWLELAYFDPSRPRAIAVWLTAYSLATIAGAVVWGRGWLRTGEGFASLFGLLAHLAPMFRDEASGRLRVRWPLSGLAEVVVRPGTAALVLVALGTTTFDGFSRTSWWQEVLGDRREWSATLVSTVGLLWVVALVAGAYALATRVCARITAADPVETARAFVPSLIPIVLAYSIAHYFSLLAFESQNFVALASDPFGRGWDLFGTIGNRVDYTALSPRTIAYVQASAIVAGHVLGVVAAHDRAVERHAGRVATRSQYPLLAVMVLYTVGGLLLLLKG
jgi:hypothetical protein